MCPPAKPTAPPEVRRAEPAEPSYVPRLTWLPRRARSRVHSSSRAVETYSWWSSKTDLDRCFHSGGVTQRMLIKFIFQVWCMFIVHVFDVFVLYFYFGVPCTFEVNIKCQLGEASEEGLFGWQQFFVPIIHARKSCRWQKGNSITNTCGLADGPDGHPFPPRSPSRDPNVPGPERDCYIKHHLTFYVDLPVPTVPQNERTFKPRSLDSRHHSGVVHV